ncbi:MAG: SH3 domain-containing protein [Patescibacteria group bacterium]
MKFKATGTINVRSSPSINGNIIQQIPVGTIVESDQYSWKEVALANGVRGYCAANFLQEAPATKWFKPIRSDKFVVTQGFLVPDSVNYPKTGHHPGVDYGTQGEDDVPLYFCSDGEVIEIGINNSFGNYFFYYANEVDKTFLYFHLRDAAPAKGKYNGGVQCGIAGKTGQSQGIHLHLECMKGRKLSSDRATLYTSYSALVAVAENADAFIRARI